MDKVILHCDLNSFFASVEVKHNPNLKGKAVAVCGSKEDRHGIVLAKTQEAKRFGVTTGEAIWQAKLKCRDLIIIPPHYELYTHYSAAAREIYYRYTDQVESFGIDECWLDVTGSKLLFGSGDCIANNIKEEIKKETGLTISVGVSFNKIFAKLGSDIKKPDAVTVIKREHFKEKVWPLNVNTMLGIGISTTKKLARHGIYTIGQLANTDINFCTKLFGKNGIDIWKNANGMGSDRISLYNNYAPIKSIGRGNTFAHDLITDEEVRLGMYFLSEDVAFRLRKNLLAAKKVQISVKNEDMISHDFQGALTVPSQSYTEIGDKAYSLFVSNYKWDKKVRALTVRAIDLVSDSEPYQLPIFCDQSLREKRLMRETVMDKIRDRYGLNSIESAALLCQRKKSPPIGYQIDTLPKPQI